MMTSKGFDGRKTFEKRPHQSKKDVLKHWVHLVSKIQKARGLLYFATRNEPAINFKCYNKFNRFSAFILS